MALSLAFAARFPRHTCVMSVTRLLVTMDGKHGLVLNIGSTLSSSHVRVPRGGHMAMGHV